MNALSPVSYEDSLKARYASVRIRLNCGIPRKAVVIPPPIETPKPVMAAVRNKARKDKQTELVPLNMLQPCCRRFLLTLACLKHKISAKRILGRERTTPVVAARNEAIALIYQHTQASMPAVGKFFGRDHTTILHSLHRQGASVKLVEMTPPTRLIARPKATKKLLPIEMAWAERSRQSDAIRAIIKAEYEKATPLRDIAKLAGVTLGSVKAIAHELELSHPNRPGAAYAAMMVQEGTSVFPVVHRVHTHHPVERKCPHSGLPIGSDAYLFRDHFRDRRGS